MKTKCLPLLLSQWCICLFHRLFRFLSVEELNARIGSRRPLPSMCKIFWVYIRNWVTSFFCLGKSTELILFFNYLFKLVYLCQISQSWPFLTLTGTRTWSLELHPWELKACASLSPLSRPFNRDRCASAARRLHSITLCLDAATKHLPSKNCVLEQKWLPCILWHV